MDFVDDLFAQKKQKAAWGRVGSTPYYGGANHFVDIQAGTSSGGSYSGEIGVQAAPSVVASIGQFGATNTDHHGWQLDINTVSQNGFNIYSFGVDMGIGWIHWLCTGN